MIQAAFRYPRPEYLLLVVVLIVGVFIPTGLFAQEKNRFRHLSTADGLSQGSVIAMEQDKNGLMWIATRDGLNRYDGRQFTVFRTDPRDSTTISNNDILEVVADRNGDLWIGTYNGLNRYDYSEERFYQFRNVENDPGSLSNNSVWSIRPMSNGDLWVGTGGGINVLRNGQFMRIPSNENEATSLPSNFVVEIFEDLKGNVWVGTSQGLARLLSEDGGRFKFKTYRHDPSDPNSLRNNFVQAINEDAQGDLWLGTRGGLHRYDPSTDSFVSYQHSIDDPNSLSHDDVRSISFDPSGHMWVGTYLGLNKMTADGQFQRILHDPNQRGSLSKNTIKSTFVDRKGSLWIGVYYGGLNILDETNNNFENYQRLPAGNGLSYDVVSSIVNGQNGEVLIGTEGGGINSLRPVLGEIRQLGSDKLGRAFSSTNIKALYRKDHLLWVGTFNAGVDIYNIHTDLLVAHYDKTDGLAHNSVYSILHEKGSKYWIGTFGGGLHLLDTSDGKIENVSGDSEGATNITDDQVRLLLKDAEGNLWIGTQYGLNFLSKKNIESGDFRFGRYFYEEEKRAGEDILVLFEDSQSQLWVGTYESGLSRYDTETDSFKSYPIFDPSVGMSNVIRGIQEDEVGNLWITSNQGLTRFNPTDGSTLTFDQSDGIVSNEFNNNACFTDKEGKMYFGSPQGLLSFYPEKIKTNQYAPDAVITGLRLFNEPVRVGAVDGVLKQSITETDIITLDYDQAIFTLEFAMPNFINPDKNQYAYRLKGLEDNWNFTNKTEATYTIQKAGTYTFEVRGANSNGVWAENITRLDMKINPAPWRTWWAFVIYLVITVFSLYALISMIQSRSKLRHELELEHLENDRQKSVNQMKLRFFTNISHEFRTPLTLILGPLEQILAEYKGSNKMFKQLKVIEKNAGRLLRLINQLMDFRKFENEHEKLQAAEGNIVKFVEEVFVSFKQYAQMHDIKLELHKGQERIDLFYDRDKLERVFFNLISNAFKYTEKGGRIIIKVEQKDNQFVCEVADTGIGMDKEHLDYIFERFYEIDETAVHPKHKQQRGTGIGLAITKGVVEMHGGTILAQSEKGQGSKFTLKLPLGKDHLHDDQIISGFRDSEDLSVYHAISLLENGEDESSGKAAEMSSNATEEHAATILIVEDNPSVRSFIVDIFRNEYKVEEAENGLEGFKKAVQLVPDLIISDVMMPKMDGIDFCTQTKTNLKTCHIPFILLTARTSLIFKFEGLESGADEYVNKPFNTRELKLKARNLINTNQKMREKFAQESVVKPSEITVSSMDEKLLKHAMQIVEDNISNEFFNIQLFSSELGVSRTMLFTKIKAWTNLTPNEFIHAMRMNRAAQLLEQNKLSVSEVSYKVGFNNPKYFSKCFQKFHKSTPSNYADRFTITEVED